MQELIDFSLGFKPRTAVMAELGLDDYGSLLRLLNAASLPHPIVPIAKRKSMVAEMIAAIKGVQNRKAESQKVGMEISEPLEATLATPGEAEVRRSGGNPSAQVNDQETGGLTPDQRKSRGTRRGASLQIH
jgi:hypothetical protein